MATSFAKVNAPAVKMPGDTSPWVRTLLKVLAYTLLIGFTVIEFVPFLWALSTSLKPELEINAGLGQNFTWLPKSLTLDSYINLFSLDQAPFARWYLNSAIVGVITTLLTLFFAATSGYAFARIPFPGRDIIFLSILGTMMIPGVITIIPIYILLGKLGLINSYPGLILPFMVTAFGIFLMRQFFVAIPLELEEAARVDGANRFRTFWQVVMPLARPALSALTIFTFMGRWNDFLMPLIIVNDKDLYTLPLGMASFRGLYKTDWGLLMSGSLLIMVPIVIMYVFFQRYFIEGISYTGLKG